MSARSCCFIEWKVGLLEVGGVELRERVGEGRSERQGRCRGLVEEEGVEGEEEDDGYGS